MLSKFTYMFYQRSIRKGGRARASAVPRMLQAKGQLTSREGGETRVPCSSLQPRAGLSAGLLERKPGPGPPGAKPKLLERRILAVQPPSPRIAQMSTNPDHKVKLSGPPLTCWVSALCLRARRRDRCGAEAQEGTPLPAPAIEIGRAHV